MLSRQQTDLGQLLLILAQPLQSQVTHIGTHIKLNKVSSYRSLIKQMENIWWS
jgi:hypothetical protein